MKRVMKLLLCLIVVLCTMLALIISAQAEIASGVYLNNAWILDDAGTLTISKSLTYGIDSWSNYKEAIKKVIIEDGVATIDKNAFFNCSSLTTVTIPNSVSSIGDSAFYGCSALTSMTIPSSVTDIGYYAFYGCSSMTSVTIPDSVSSIGFAAFYECRSMTSVTIPNNVANIAEYTFFECVSLKSVTIPNSVTSIGESAFSICNSLKTVTIPNTVINFGKNAFPYKCVIYTTSGSAAVNFAQENGNVCLLLDDLPGGKYGTLTWSISKDLVLTISGTKVPTNTDAPWTRYRSAIRKIVLKNVTSISSDAFSYFEEMTSITIPESVTSIGNNAFSGCISLSSVTIPDSVTTLGSQAFAGCRSLTSVTIPNSIATIGDYTFSGCSSLTSMMIPNSVCSIGYSAFCNCSALTSVTIPDGVCDIETSTFSGCSSLKSVKIPRSVSIIGGNAFYACSSLTSIVIPSSVYLIGSSAFIGCNALKIVTIPDSVTSIGSNAFSLNTTICCSKGSYAYQWANEQGYEIIDFTIKSQPQSIKAVPGTKTKFSVETTGDGLTYQWQYKKPGATWQNTSATGNTTATLTVPVTTDRDGYQYRCVVMNQKKKELISDSATLTVVSAMITEQPTGQTVGCGGKANFTVTVLGDDVKYQWQCKIPGTDWKNSPATGSTTATLSIPATLDRSGYQYRCVITGNDGKQITSKAVTLKVINITITKQPVSQKVSNGASIKFTVTAKGDGLQYQWQYKKTDTAWKNSPATGNTTATVTITASMDKDGYQYRCVLTNSAGEKINSAAATLDVMDLSITKQPASQTVRKGTTVEFTVTAKGTELTYQWQYMQPEGAWKNSPATGSNTASLSVSATADRNGYKYRCVVRNKDGDELISNVATLTVSSLAITTQPVSKSVSNGTNVEFTVVAKGDGVKYQWQYRISKSDAWQNSPATGNKTATLSISGTTNRNGYQYRCVVKDQYGITINSNAATLTVGPALSIKTQPVSKTADNGTNATFTVVANGAGLTYQWQYRTSSTATWKNTTATGCTTASLTVAVTATKNGYQYHCIVKDKYGASVTSDAATLTVSVPLKIKSQPADKAVAAGTDAVFTVTAGGNGLTYQWQYRKNATAEWSNSPATGNKTATLTVAATVTKNGYQYRCIIKDSTGASVITKVVTLTVQ
ncbi:MAG: leucine-rich repeat protein [Clostridia bacterium]|nr:leucine-rich repeat protein [Clostridia bacterium]